MSLGCFVNLAPVPSPPGTPRTQAVSPLAQSATAMHISTRLLFQGACPPPRNPIIVTVTSPMAARRNVRRTNCPQEPTVFDTLLRLVPTVHTYAGSSFADERPGIL